MAKSARSSVRKTNNKKLKSRVFGPAEDARTQRLSAKLLELASQPKSPKAEMEVEEDADKNEQVEEKEAEHADDTVMDVDNATKKDAARPMSNNAAKKAKQDKKDRIAKKRHRKPTNSMTFKNKVGKKRK